MAKLTVYSDPGHSWVKVTGKQLEWAGVKDKITSFSYIRAGRNGMTVYLEEDCDWPTFKKACEDKGRFFQLVEKFSDKASKIRSYACYDQKYLM